MEEKGRLRDKQELEKRKPAHLGTCWMLAHVDKTFLQSPRILEGEQRANDTDWGQAG